jgi:hypothetical protein
MVVGRRFRGAHAARVRARVARPRELFFVWALSFGSILFKVRFGEPPKPAREPRALPRLPRSGRCIHENTSGKTGSYR